MDERKVPGFVMKHMAALDRDTASMRDWFNSLTAEQVEALIAQCEGRAVSRSDPYGEAIARLAIAACNIFTLQRCESTIERIHA